MAKSPSDIPGIKSPTLSSAVVATMRHATNPEGHIREVRSARTSAKRKYNSIQERYKKELQELLKKALESDTPPRIPNKLIEKYFLVAYTTGVKASGVPNPVIPHEDLKWIMSAVREETKYLRKFLKDVHSGGGEMDYSRRMDMYIRTLSYMYEVGRISSSSEHVLIYWIIDSHAENCPHCQYLAANSPYTKKTLPTVPRAGDTKCLSNCKCRLMVRHTSPAEVMRVEKGKPDKKEFLRLMKRAG